MVPRVGAADAEALAALGFTAIDRTEIGASSTDSHSKFVVAPAVVQRIGQGLNSVPDFDGGPRTGLEDLVGVLPIQVIGGE